MTEKEKKLDEKNMEKISGGTFDLNFVANVSISKENKNIDNSKTANINGGNVYGDITLT